MIRPVFVAGTTQYQADIPDQPPGGIQPIVKNPVWRTGLQIVVLPVFYESIGQFLCVIVRYSKGRWRMDRCPNPDDLIDPIDHPQFQIDPRSAALQIFFPIQTVEKWDRIQRIGFLIILALLIIENRDADRGAQIELVIIIAGN